MNEMEENIESFVDEMILIIYKGKTHTIARDYYRKLFRELIPKYFVPTSVNGTRPGEHS